MPRRMDKIAGRLKEPRRKRARSKGLPVLLALITLWGYAARQHRALHPDPDPWMQKMLSDEDSDSNEHSGFRNKTDRIKRQKKAAPALITPALSLFCEAYCVSYR